VTFRCVAADREQAKVPNMENAPAKKALAVLDNPPPAEIPKAARLAAARAGAVKVDLMESDNAIARDRASSFVLGLAGIQPATAPSVNVNIEMKAGYVIDLTDDPPPMRTIPHS